jgi:hypothetical protein
MNVNATVYGPVILLIKFAILLQYLALLAPCRSQRLPILWSLERDRYQHFVLCCDNSTEHSPLQSLRSNLESVGRRFQMYQSRGRIYRHDSVQHHFEFGNPPSTHQKRLGFAYTDSKQDSHQYASRHWWPVGKALIYPPSADANKSGRVLPTLGS